MNRSEAIADLATALSKAQAQMRGAARDSENPYHKSTYADLASCWHACREPLTKNGLAVVQLARADAAHAEVETVLMHSSGQWIAESLRFPATPGKDGRITAQSMGSAVTYARRYGLMAICGIAPDDDDGNAASAPDDHATQPRQAPPARTEADLESWRQNVASLDGADAFNLFVSQAGRIGRALREPVWKLLVAAATEKGLTWDGSTKLFVPAQPAGESDG